MFIAIIFLVTFLTWKYADWRNWQQYQATMLFFMMGNLFYNFVYHDRFLWKFEPDIFNHHIVEIIYTFSVYPLTALIFLSRLPTGPKSQILHFIKYIIIYSAFEFYFLQTGRILYNFGWSFPLSVIWDTMMFPLMALHRKKPLIAYSICGVLIFVMNWLFPYNLK